MKIFELIKTIKEKSPVLYWVGILNFILSLICIGLYFNDDRLISGVNAWIKPMKFGLSVGIYLWTFGWLLPFLQNKKYSKIIGWGIIICMIVENSIITLQAARGITSHYNISSSLDAILFSLMGAFIGINTFLILTTWLLFIFSPSSLDGNMLLAWQCGLFLFLVGGVAGGMMIGNLAHTVGATDGGPGIPLLDWSTVAGDLRSAHFITLHGLQAIPLFAFFVSSKSNKPKLITFLFFAGYCFVCVGLHWLALNGKPFFIIN